VNLDPEKLLVLFIIALLVLGPNRLPQAARTLGKGLAEVRRYTASFRAEVDEVLAEPRAMMQSGLHEMDMRARLKRSLLDDPEPPAPPAASTPGAGPSGIAADGDQSPGQAGPGPLALPSAVPDEPGLN
jgi:sec-independent protein translocase protein TatB